MFSAFWAIITFFGVLIFASGGSAKAPRLDLALIGAGIAFIVTLVVAAMLSMSHKANEAHLGKGSGVNLSSKRPAAGHGYRADGTDGAGAPDAPPRDNGH